MAHAEKRTYDKAQRKWRYRGKYKLPNGKWGSVSRDDNDQPFYTARSAVEYAQGLESDVRRKTFVNPRDGRLTVEEWSKLWLESVELGNRSDKSYRQRLRSVILPHWGATAMGDITTVAVTTWEKQLRARYKPNYVKSTMSVMRVMFDDAVASKVRGDNPVPTLRSRRRGKYKGKEQQDEVVTATPRQILLLARNAQEIRGLTGYAMVATIAYAGLRISEMAGLRREHLLLKDTGSGCRLLVQQQHQYVDGKPAQVDPKYGSTGSLILAPFHAELLRELIDSHSSEWVFPAPRGGKLDTGQQFYKNTWRRIVDGNPVPPAGAASRDRLPSLHAVAGVEGLVPHGARHSMKVWLDERKHPRAAVEARMRHVLQGIEGVYSHVTLAMELAIAADLQQMWEAALRMVEVDRREWEPARWQWEPAPSAVRARKLISQMSPTET
ncbi:MULTISPECIES: hypothetical protein [unclassified Streptomyces]|uniref:tyrosine-type recombinase/integrase n=1 Tax=unclassified Streptomyces TaxID=2593676 RepID=UPI00278C0994|nr:MULTISPECIES: hypothetical protein [unclassified Streptomyces]